MTRLVGYVAACVLGLLLGAAVTPSAQFTAQGVVIRADGSVLIDPWTVYPSTPPPPPGQMPPAVHAPTKVVFGETVVDSTPVCREGPLGSRCLPLGKLLPKLP